MSDADTQTFRDRALSGGGNPLEQLDRLFRLTGRRTWAAVAALGVLVAAVIGWGVIAQRDKTVSAPGMLVPKEGFIEVGRLDSGVISDVEVEDGEVVQGGEVLATYLGPGGVEGEIIAPVDGVVAEVDVAPGSTLVAGLPAFTLLPGRAQVVAVALASPQVHAQIDVGYDVTIQAASAPPAQYGSIRGRVVDISDTPITLARLALLTGGNEQFAQALLSAGPAYEVEVALKRDPTTASGYAWTTEDGPDYPVPAGTLVQVTAQVDRSSIVSELLK